MNKRLTTGAKAYEISGQEEEELQEAPTPGGWASVAWARLPPHSPSRTGGQQLDSGSSGASITSSRAEKNTETDRKEGYRREDISADSKVGKAQEG